MIKNYFKIALRNLARNKAFSFINIFGLAVGLASCLLILLYIFDESSYDKYQKDGGRLFRVASVSNKTEPLQPTPRWRMTRSALRTFRQQSGGRGA